jgi:hypothetical protein
MVKKGRGRTGVIERTLRVLGCALALLLAAPSAVPQTAAIAPEPAVTQHRLKAGGIDLAYTATAGVMTIRLPDKGLVGDMSYVAYTVAPKRGAPPRPLAFLWNGGPGSATLPLHYGAFGPMRLNQPLRDKLAPNPASLLDVADLVFVDMIETGFGRVAESVRREDVLNAATDADAFAEFVTTWRSAGQRSRQPLVLIGESYGVRRAVSVIPLLQTRGVQTDHVVLISGYPNVTDSLDLNLSGALRIPAYAAFAFERTLARIDGVSSPMGAYQAALSWVRSLPTQTEPAKAEDIWPTIASKLPHFVGPLTPRVPSSIPALRPPSFAAGDIGRRLADEASLSLSRHDMYDLRYPHGMFDKAWISQAIVHDLRQSLKLDHERRYIGLEWAEEAVERTYTSSGSTGRLTALPVERPADGLASRLSNPHARWGSGARTLKTTPAEMMSSAPQLDLFIVAGVYDYLFPCAYSEAMAERDLAAFRHRAKHKCYAGGHMMYYDRTVGDELSRDVRAFIRKR